MMDFLKPLADLEAGAVQRAADSAASVPESASEQVRAWAMSVEEPALE